MGSRRTIHIFVSASLAAVWLIQPLAADARPYCLGRPVTHLRFVLDDEIAGSNGSDVILGSSGNDFIVDSTETI